ncbi:hypothetical protein Aoki45_08270 [Algoriphagus sp. oki45]|uniref:response regulator n=1 Tax=Algoriphagus sp. oki45 TaxID=3067294 RepID=UPI0027FA4F8F|nr:hypothetical protein Aoki45_08270 [Algoriphagus sp. oki45]
MSSPLKRSNFFLLTAVGSALIFMVIFLGFSFFNAIYQTQVQSRKDFLSQQTALASRGLESEIDRFKSESGFFADNIADQLEDINSDPDRLVRTTRQLFNAFPGMIDHLWMDLGDSVLLFSLTSRNDFLVQKDAEGLPSLGELDSFIQLDREGVKFVFLLDLPDFSKGYVSIFYLDQGGEKFLFLNNKLISLDQGKDSISLDPDQEAILKAKEDISLGLKGIYPVSWEDEEKGAVAGTLAQYPFNFSPSKGDAALVFLVPTENLTSGIYSTYLFVFFILAVILVGMITVFIFSLKSKFKADRLREKNLEEISSLFEQQNLLLKELKGFVFFHDHLGQITEVSEQVEEILGHTREDFIYSFKKDSTHPEANQVKSTVMEMVAEGKDLVDLEYDFIKPNGEKIRVRVFTKVVFDENGRFERGFGLGIDITKQYVAQQKILQSETRLKNLIKNIPDTIFIYDRQGDVIDFHVIDSETLLESAKETLGRNISEIVPHNQEELVIGAFKKSIQTKKMQTVQVFWNSPMGEKHYEMRFFSLDDNQVMSLSRDITSQKIWEKGLVEAMNAADQASQAKSQFLANMSHEIRTPMNGLLGIIDLLEGTKLGQIQKQYVEIIKNSGNTLLDIIRDILDYSKIESGKIEINKEIFDPAKEIHVQKEMLSGLAKKKQIDLKVLVNLDENLVFEGDKNKINQILLNLMGNALKFTPEGGSVTVRLELEDIGSDLYFLSYEVQDTGIGISEENIKNLTQPFYQVDSSISKNFQGTGLGLAIAKRMIELLGGELKIESKLGEGSKFAFSIMVKRAEKEDLASGNQVLTWKDVKDMGAEFPLRVLLAEDNELNQQLMTLMFEQLGFEYDTVKSGKEALQRVQEKDFDVVLMDVQMPDMNGLEATREIRKLKDKKGLIIIGLSANVFEEDQKEALKAGMDDYLTKPIRLAVLADKLEFYFRKVRGEEIS